MAFAQEAVIREMAGAVELRTAGSADWVPAKTGDRIARSTVISTGFKSTAILAVGSSTFTVRPLTRLSLEAFMNPNNTETINVALSAGRVRVDVNPPAGGRASVSVQSPIATASVRGTVFEIDPVSLRVSEGTVTYQGGNGQAVMVSAGQSSRLDESGKAANPYALADAERPLPALPGMESRPDAESGAALKITIIDANITLISGN
jgi:hypothetical protein